MKGETNPSDVMTKHLQTGEQMKRAVEMLGMIDLTQDGLDKHVSKNEMKAIGAVGDDAQEGSTNNKSNRFKMPGNTGVTAVEILPRMSLVLNLMFLHEFCAAFCCVDVKKLKMVQRGRRPQEEKTEPNTQRTDWQTGDT